MSSHKLKQWRSVDRFKYSLPVSWRSQKKHICDPPYFLQILEYFCQWKFTQVKVVAPLSVCLVAWCGFVSFFSSLFVWQTPVIIKICHWAFYFLLVPYETQTWKCRLTFYHLKLFHWDAWVFPSISLRQQFATMTSLPQWDETKFIF